MRYEPLKPHIPLTRAGTDEVVAQACGSCGRVWPDHLIAQCCAKKYCDCGAEITSNCYTACNACRNRAAREKEAARRTNAEVVADYEGPVYWEEGDKFFSDVGEALEYWEDDPEDEGVVPAKQTLWTSYEVPFQLNAREIVDCALEAQDHCEEAYDDIATTSEIEELQTFLDGWVERYCSDTKTYFADFRKRVKLEGVR